MSDTLATQINFTEVQIAGLQQRLEQDPGNDRLERYLQEELEFLEVLEDIVNERGILEVLDVSTTVQR